MKMKNYLKVTVFWVAVLSVWCLKPTKKSQDTLFVAECRSFGKWRRAFTDSLLLARLCRLSC